MKEKTIRVLKVEPHKAPVIAEIENELSALQDAVSIGADYRGLIEILTLSDDVCILCNEEGKLIGLEPNRRFFNDILCGVFYVTGQNDEGDLCSLSTKNMEYYQKEFAIPEKISKEEAENAIFFDFYIG